MSSKIFCFYKDKLNIWKPATQEMFDQAAVSLQMFPCKDAKGNIGYTEVIVYKNAQDLWDKFRFYLKVERKKQGKVFATVNGQAVTLAFGSGLSCDKLNEFEKWKPFNGISRLEPYVIEGKYKLKSKDGKKVYEATLKHLTEKEYLGLKYRNNKNYFPEISETFVCNNVEISGDIIDSYMFVSAPKQTCSDYRASSESQLYSEQLNCEKTGMFVNRNQKACSHIQKKYEVEWKPYKGIDKLYLPNPELDKQFVGYEVKYKDGSTEIVVYVKDFEDIYCSNPDATYTQVTNEFQNLDGHKVDDSRFVAYRLVEKNNLPKCPYKDYEEGCCSDCPFKNKPGCREKEWDKIQAQWQEDAYNEERREQEMMGACNGCPYWNGCPVQDRYQCPEGF